MLNDGFYSTAPLDSPRVKKWFSVQIRRQIEHSAAKSRKLSAPVNMKNRNIVDYLGLCHTVWTPRVRIPYSTHGGWNRRLTEGSFLPPARAGQNPAGPPQSCTLLWTSAWYLHPCQTCWHCSSSWQSLVCFCTTTIIKIIITIIDCMELQTNRQGKTVRAHLCESDTMRVAPKVHVWQKTRWQAGHIQNIVLHVHVQYSLRQESKDLHLKARPWGSFCMFTFILSIVTCCTRHAMCTSPTYTYAGHQAVKKIKIRLRPRYYGITRLKPCYINHIPFFFTWMERQQA